MLTSSARDLTLEAAQSASSSRGIRIPPLISSAKPASTAQIKKLLDSRSERDVLEGLRNVISVKSSLRLPPQDYSLMCYIFSCPTNLTSPTQSPTPSFPRWSRPSLHIPYLSGSLCTYTSSSTLNPIRIWPSSPSMRFRDPLPIRILWFEPWPCE